MWNGKNAFFMVDAKGANCIFHVGKKMDAPIREKNRIAKLRIVNS